MSRITVDAALRSQLRDFHEPLELCDESGRVLARVFPVVDASAYEGLESPLTREEIDRRKLNKGKTYTTREVLDYLEKL